MSEPCERRKLSSEAGMRSVRTRLAHIAGAEHDERRLALPQRLVTQTEPRQDTRPHILDEDIGPLDQAMGKIEPLSVFQIEGHTGFGIAEKSEASRAVQSDFPIFVGRI